MPAINVSTDGSILAIDGAIRVGLLPSNPPSRIMPTFNLTAVAAAAAQQTAMQMISNQAINLYDGQPLLMSNGLQVTTAGNNNAATLLPGVNATITVAQSAPITTTALWLQADQPVTLTPGTVLDFGGYRITLTVTTTITTTAAPITVPALIVALKVGTTAIVGAGQATLGTSTVTLTATAAAVLNAVTMTISSSVDRFFPAGSQFLFGATLVTTAIGITLTAAGVAVATQPLPGAVAASATSTAGFTVFVQPLQAAVTVNATTPTRNLVEILGVESMDQTGKSTLVSTRTMKSGLGNSQRVAMNDTSIPCSGIFNANSLAHKLVILPAFRNSTEVYAEVYTGEGETLLAPGIIANLNKQYKLGDVMKYSFDLMVQDLPRYAYS